MEFAVFGGGQVGEDVDQPGVRFDAFGFGLLLENKASRKHAEHGEAQADAGDGTQQETDPGTDTDHGRALQVAAGDQLAEHGTHKRA